MSALYVMRYVGGTGNTGVGAIYIGKGTIVGVDVQNGRYHGTFTDHEGRVKATVVCPRQKVSRCDRHQVAPGTTVPLTADWPADFANGQPQQIMVQGRPVQVTFEKIGDVP